MTEQVMSILGGIYFRRMKQKEKDPKVDVEACVAGME